MWAALVVYLVTSMTPGIDLVLCFGADGHVAIEAATADASCFDCPDETAASASCCSDPETGSGGCTCSDVPLLSNVRDAERTVADPGLVLAPPCAICVELVDFEPLPGRLHGLLGSAHLPPRALVPALLVLRV